MEWNSNSDKNQALLHFNFELEPINLCTFTPSILFMPAFTFKKAERLKSRKIIGRLFKEGYSFGVYPLRLVFLKNEEPRQDAPVQFTVSVPKRSFKSAVVRNRLKRKVREAWRLNKHWLYRKLENTEGQFAFMVIYTGKEEFPYKEIEKAMRNLNYRFAKRNIPPKPNPDKGTKPLSWKLIQRCEPFYSFFSFFP